MTKDEAVELVVNEIDLWLAMYDKESEIYAELCKALAVLRRT